MATKLFLRNTTLNGFIDSGTASSVRDMSTTAGSAGTPATSNSFNTTAGGTEIGGQGWFWISGYTPSGGFTLTSTDISVWMLESNMSANIGGRYRVYKLASGASWGAETELGGGPFDDGVEFGTTSTEMTWVGNVTDTAFAVNDRLIMKLFITGVGGMAAGFSGQLAFDTADGGAADSFFNIAETVAFLSSPFVPGVALPVPSPPSPSTRHMLVR